MDQDPQNREIGENACIAFVGRSCAAKGSLDEVALAAKRALQEDRNSIIVILDATTSLPVEVDFRGTPEDVLTRLEAGRGDLANEAAAPPNRRGLPGRPRLGVVAREVTLLPRHWEWLNGQPGGASVTLRKLVEEARRTTAGEARLRRARESCHRFATIMAGDEPGYEEALRALFAGDRERFEVFTRTWPADVRDHARLLAAGSFVDGATGKTED